MSNFNLLDESIRNIVWDMGWTHFRPVQDEAAGIILKSEEDLVISAPTASGKTEAAFLPLLSRFKYELRSELTILCISPLKALINDQYNRITALCERLEYRVTKWHGDAGRRTKRELLKNPEGILIITPESLESLLIRQEKYSQRLLAKVQCIVIDEIHSFLESPRGAQLYSLLQRIHFLTGSPQIRKIALSATIGNLSFVGQFLSADGNFKVVSVTDKSKDIYGRIITVPADHFKIKLYHLIRTGKTLIFDNSKSRLELFCDSMKKMSMQKRDFHRIRIHHGSLSKEIRENLEKELKETQHLAVFCTNTLELGIDIGNIDKIVFLSPPWSVSSFTQRIGRSGRKEGVPIQFQFLFASNEYNCNSPVPERLGMDMIKAIALIELSIKGFSEPFKPHKFDFSVLVHQVLAAVAQKGGISLALLYEMIVVKSFKNILTVDEFILLLRYLKRIGMIEQMANGDILPGKKGEKLTAHYNFYSVFHTPKVWTVEWNGERIGEIPFIFVFAPGELILLSGRRWEVISTDLELKKIIVKPTIKVNSAFFDGSIRDSPKRLHEKMEEIYRNKILPKYLDDNSADYVSRCFREFDSLVKDKRCIFIFRGTRAQRTIELFLKNRKIPFESFEGGFRLIFHTRQDFKTLMKNSPPDRKKIQIIVSKLRRNEKIINKYDHLLPDFLLDRSFIQNELEVYADGHDEEKY